MTYHGLFDAYFEASTLSALDPTPHSNENTKTPRKWVASLEE
jgi:hypothetical protein